MPRKDAGAAISAQAQQELISDGIENFELPKSLVTRIAKSALPDNAKMQKETVLSLVKGSTVFINYLAATAHDVALSKQHKSISASDVLKALETIEFGDLVDKLQGELAVYRELAKTDKSKKGTSISAAVPSGKGKGKAPSTSTSASAAAPASESSASTPAPRSPSLSVKIVLPPPTGSSSFATTPAGEEESISSGSGAVGDMDVDGDENDGEVGEGEGERLDDDLVDEDEVLEDVDDDEEPEELVDTVALDMEDILEDSVMQE
ncbi:histone-fold-containing protein [Mycena amicta]|nr:histone-fold-containing protein [Mycena amicta]